MKKSIIWLLTIVMSIAFGALLYFQIMYLENMVKMRDEQFSEGVMRSLNATAAFLEREETLHFLQQDINIIESSVYDEYSINDETGNLQSNGGSTNNLKYSIDNHDGSVTNYTLSADRKNKSTSEHQLSYPSSSFNLSERFRNMQEIIRSQYLYQKGLLSEVILSILRDSGTRPATERADSMLIKNCLTTELENNGLKVPFVFAVYNKNGTQMIYSTEGYTQSSKRDTYDIPLFSNTATSYQLRIQFPTKDLYIFSSVRFIIPTLVLTIILLVIFLYTIILAFKQKKLSEMKTDFINNMTHELKTPISSISLAGQMLSDPSVRKSPQTLEHLSAVITDESKRLRFQVEKVLQMSVFDNTGNALKFSTIDANTIISNVVNTFKLKVEKYGGSLKCELKANNAWINVDEMQFTNVIFNLLDNAVKYMDPDREPHLEIETTNPFKGKIEIRVKDNGIGIKRDNLKRIFEKFYRVSTGNLHDVKGFGLGLAYVKKMITLFGGTITAESDFGKGSTFIILLPSTKEPNLKIE